MVFMRPDGVSRITRNDRCPRRPIAQITIVALAAIAVAWSVVPGSHPFFVIAAILLVTSVMSWIIRWGVRRKRSRAGACLTYSHPCIQPLPDTDAEPVLLQLGRPRPEWTASEHVWQELQAYDRDRGR